MQLNQDLIKTLRGHACALETLSRINTTDSLFRKVLTQPLGKQIRKKLGD